MKVVAVNAVLWQKEDTFPLVVINVTANNHRWISSLHIPLLFYFYFKLNSQPPFLFLLGLPSFTPAVGASHVPTHPNKLLLHVPSSQSILFNSKILIFNDLLFSTRHQQQKYIHTKLFYKISSYLMYSLEICSNLCITTNSYILI